jgi:hypothetical protein
MSLLDDQHELATPWLEVSEEGVAGLVKILQSIPMQPATDREIEAKGDVHGSKSQT